MRAGVFLVAFHGRRARFASFQPTTPTMNATDTTAAAARFFTVAFHEGSEVNPAERLEAAEKRLAAAKAALASGHFLVASASGQMRMMDPRYFAGQFRPMRWMAKEDIDAARRVPSMEVGETVMLAEGFHPRHGVKRRPMTSLA